MPHFSETYVSAFIVIPKYFSFTVVPRTVFPILHFISNFPCLVFRHLNFPELNSFCHLSDDLNNMSRSFGKCSLSPSMLNF